MNSESRIVSSALLLMLLAAMSGPLAVRLLRQADSVSATWRVIALAADLTSVLALAAIAALAGYALRRLALVEVESEE